MARPLLLAVAAPAIVLAVDAWRRRRRPSRPLPPLLVDATAFSTLFTITAANHVVLVLPVVVFAVVATFLVPMRWTALVAAYTVGWSFLGAAVPNSRSWMATAADEVLVWSAVVVLIAEFAALLRAAQHSLAAGHRAQAALEDLIDDLDRRLTAQRAIAECSGVLLRHDQGASVEDALAVFREAVGAEHVFVEQNVVDPRFGMSAHDTYTSTVAGFRPPTSRHLWQELAGAEEPLDRLPHSLLPNVYGRLRAGALSVVETKDLHGTERTIFEACGIVTEASAPIMADGQWVGVLGALRFTPGTAWRDDDLALLRTTADMFGSFLAARQRQRALEDLVASKDQFIASVSHELRTPLTTVVGLAHELRDASSSLGEDERSQLMNLLADQSMDMADLVDDLLVAARADTGQVVVAPEPMDLLEVAKRIVDERARWDGGAARMTVVGAETGAYADPSRVRQIVRNLLSNAIRYGGPTVVVEVGTDRDCSFVRVVDDGEGIPPDDRDIIFEPYRRAHSAGPQPGSVGIGLTVSRTLAQLMGGDVVYTYDERGSTFTLTMPRSPS